MTLFQAILLGIVQGLTEFIPISSTAHLVLAMRAMDLALTPEQATASMAVIQLGTLLAVLVYFAGDIWRITRAFVHDHLVILKDGRRDQFNRENEHARLSTDAWLGWLIIIGTIPVVIVGLIFKKQIEGSFTKNLWIIATMMIVVALLLIVAEVVGKRKRRLQDLGRGECRHAGDARTLLTSGSDAPSNDVLDVFRIKRVARRQSLQRLRQQLLRVDLRESTAIFLAASARGANGIDDPGVCHHVLLSR